MTAKEELDMVQLKELKRAIKAFEGIAREESQEEPRLRDDYNYALNNSGLGDAIDALIDVLKFMNNYGHEMSMKDLLEEI